jgi:hypothetical protein
VGQREAVIVREDVEAALAALFDIRTELVTIRILLSSDDGEKEIDEPE